MSLVRRLTAAVLALMIPALAMAEPLAPARLDLGLSGFTDSESGIAIALAPSRPVSVRTRVLADPPRLVVDFLGAAIAPAEAAALDRSDRVRWLAAGPPRFGWVRLTAVLDGFYLPASALSDRGTGIAFLELIPADGDAFGRAALSTTWDDLPATGPAAPRPRPRRTGDRPLVVMLDPGHGGIDPGAEAGPTTEADLMLGFAQELSRALATQGILAPLTRTEDQFVSLETRLSLARSIDADLFISLHADAVEAGTAIGARVFVHAETGTDEAVVRLVERHQRGDLLAGVDLGGQEDGLAGILIELAQTETRPRSERLARDLVAAFGAADIRTHRKPVEAGDFAVLRAPDIPAALLELGFLSSASDRRRLADPEWRAKMAGAIAAALASWALADAEEALLLRR